MRVTMEQQEAMRKLRDFAVGLDDGEIVGWTDIEVATGVKMDIKGRARFCTVLRRLKRPYVNKPGYGVEMSCSENALEIVQIRGRRVGSALSNAREVTEQVSGRHLADMPSADRERLKHYQAVLATLALSESLTKKLSE